MFVTLVTAYLFYGVKEDIPSGTGGGQTVKDIFERQFCPVFPSTIFLRLGLPSTLSVTKTELIH